MRGCFATLTASKAVRMSFSVARARPQMIGGSLLGRPSIGRRCRPRRRSLCTASKSSGEADGKPGLDHVHAEPRKRPRHLELLFRRERRAGRLLAVAKRRVEDANVVGGRGLTLAGHWTLSFPLRDRCWTSGCGDAAYGLGLLDGAWRRRHRRRASWRRCRSAPFRAMPNGSRIATRPSILSWVPVISTISVSGPTSTARARNTSHELQHFARACSGRR